MFETRPQLDDIFIADSYEYRVSAIYATHAIGTLATVTGTPSDASEITRVPIENPPQELSRNDIDTAESVIAWLETR